MNGDDSAADSGPSSRMLDGRDASGNDGRNGLFGGEGEGC